VADSCRRAEWGAFGSGFSRDAFHVESAGKGIAAEGAPTRFLSRVPANPAQGFIFPRIKLECAAPQGMPMFIGIPRNKFQKFQRLKMVKIRLSRGGAKKRPFYHIIVTDERNARDGRNIERVGYFNPIAAGKDIRLQLDTVRVKSWMDKGAQMTEKVRSLYKEAGKQVAAA